MASFPTITYSNIIHKIDAGLVEGVITYQDENITPIFNNGAGSTVYMASYNFPFNSITGNFTPNRELSRFEIRVNPIEVNNFGPGIGNLAFSKINDMPANASRSFSISITTNTFTGSNSNTYRICLMGQSSVDYSWDCTQLFMVVGPGTTFKPKNSDGYDVHFDTIV